MYNVTTTGKIGRGINGVETVTITNISYPDKAQLIKQLSDGAKFVTVTGKVNKDSWDKWPNSVWNGEKEFVLNADHIIAIFD